MTMSTQTSAFEAADFAVLRETRASKPGFFARAFEAYSNAMMDAARVRITRHLQDLSDDRLVSFGMTDEQIAELRRTGVVPAAFWDR